VSFTGFTRRFVAAPADPALAVLVAAVPVLAPAGRLLVVGDL
jgi:hypothetical protein